jgi:tRNA(Ile)-lysidine synthase
MIFSPAALTHFLPELPREATGWVALSGGLDSCVLLHALVALKLPVKIHALHINHQLSPNAENWQQHCADFCAQLNVPFTAIKVDVKNSGRGLEDAAREARYAVFEQHLHTGDYLLTAHHADDQTETMLLRLMRGTGPRGLAAMAQSRPLALGNLYRPLLHFTRTELEEYAHAKKIKWVNDESNANNHYDRNFLRNKVMPLLRERWPTFANQWQQTAELCAANEVLIDELAAQDLLLAAMQTEFIGTSISLVYCKNLSPERRHNLLRYWLRGQSLHTPEQVHLQQIEQQIIHGRQDAATQIDWGDVSLRVYRQRIYALPLIDFPINIELKFILTEAGEKPLLKSDLPNLHIRYRQGGERCRPLGRAHSQTLKRLLQDYSVAPWLRENLPLVFSADDLVAVSDLWICEGYVAEGSGFCLKFELQESPSLE